MAELCQSINDAQINWSVTSDVNFTGRSEITCEEMPNNTSLAGMTPSSAEVVRSMWITDEFQRCDNEGCNGPLYPDHTRSEASTWRFTPPQIGPATYDNFSSEDDDTIASNTVATTAVGFGAGLAIGAAAIGSKVFFAGSTVMWTPVGWGLMIGGGILAIGGGVVGYFVGQGTKNERDLVNAGLDKSKVSGWGRNVRSLTGEFVNLAQAGMALQNKDAAVLTYINAVKLEFERFGTVRYVCVPDIDFVRIIAPADLDEKTMTTSLDALARGSGDREMADIVLAGYYAQKADKAATARDNEAAKAAIEKVRDILHLYTCNDFTIMNASSGKRDELIEAILGLAKDAEGRLTPPKTAKECLSEKPKGTMIQDGKGGCEPCPKDKPRTKDGVSCYMPKKTTGGTTSSGGNAGGGGTPVDEWGGSNPYR